MLACIVEMYYDAMPTLNSRMKFTLTCHFLICWGQLDILKGHNSEWFLFRMVFIWKGHYSEPFIPKGHYSEDFLFRWVIMVIIPNFGITTLQDINLSK